MKSWIIKKYGSVNNYFGKHGFRIPQKVKQVDNPINIKDLPNKDEINLNEMGYTKLLSKGNINRKIKIIVKKCSKNAKDKIEKAGGQVIIQ
jgi:large subunit ribosomal protein L15